MRLHRLVTLAAPLALAALAGGAHAATYQRVYSFRGTDGNQPFGKMAFDPSGALYGCNDSALPLHATLWKLQPPAARVTAWKLTVLQDMGGSPCQGVIRDGMGRLFIDNEVAVTMFVPGSPPSWTTVIPVSPDEDSFSDITLGPQGQIFAAHDGGNSLVRALPGHGGWLLQTVYQFGVNDGATDPNSLSTGPDGTVYGTARGTSSVGGYLYQKSPSETGITFLTGVPATFGNLLGMTLDTTGNIYGATAKGVFKWWRLGSRPPTMLASFTTAPGGGGYYPPFPPVLGNDGALYGVTTPSNSAGAVYRVTPTGQHTFAGNEWGSQAALVQGPGGWLYGTGLGGAHGQGFVFRVHIYQPVDESGPADSPPS